MRTFPLSWNVKTGKYAGKYLNDSYRSTVILKTTHAIELNPDKVNYIVKMLGYINNCYICRRKLLFSFPLLFLSQQKIAVESKAKNWRTSLNF